MLYLNYYTIIYTYKIYLSWAFDFNLVTFLLGTGMITKVVYVVVGLAAVLVTYTKFVAK